MTNGTEHGLTADIEVIPIDRVVAKDVRFHFVIDDSPLPKAGA
jgi:hypothetical protein